MKPISNLLWKTILIKIEDIPAMGYHELFPLIKKVIYIINLIIIDVFKYIFQISVDIFVLTTLPIRGNIVYTSRCSVLIVTMVTDRIFLSAQQYIFGFEEHTCRHT